MSDMSWGGEHVRRAKEVLEEEGLRAAQWLRLPSQDPGGAGPDGLRFTPEAAVLANQDHAEAPVQPEEIPDGLRDAYVNFMLRIANTRVMSGAVDPSFGGFGRVPLKEYDEKMIVQIYNSLLMAHAQRVPCDAAKLATQIGSSTL
ncbi:hypothetical protein Acr_23g0021580 [Actinidia rufa]|uniref:Uncharacterized protein n=1 Tax=Actinidia rufa TaxID=165716 RepID=A0A7J0GSK4_9ERIC|nr:hypothetical protein Acr_23g0021580 [Actinidia rufa]